MLSKQDENQDIVAQQELIGDRYQVIEALGKGGMGVVLKARHVGLGKVVAIKVLSAAMLVDEVSRKRFEIEAKAAGNLSHPNLIAVFDYGFTNQGDPFIVMEFVDGIGLDRYIRRSEQLPFDDCLEIFLQIGKALQYVHNNNIIHRDLKPSNVMIHLIGDERYAKLLDFGIAKVFTDDGQPSQHLTATGATFGSPLYMSPEQCQGMKVDARADIYSFGCLMYECIAGDPPIVGDNALHTIFKQVSDIPKLLPSKNGAEHQLALVVDKCLQKQPADRYQNVGELLTALSKLQPNSINPGGSKEHTGSQAGQPMGGGFGAHWGKQTETPTTFTPVAQTIDFQPTRPPQDNDSSSARPPRPRMTRPDTAPPPAGSWVPSQPVAAPASQQPPPSDWMGSATKKMFKFWLFVVAAWMCIAVVLFVVRGSFEYAEAVKRLPQLQQDTNALYEKNHLQMQKMLQLNSPATPAGR